LKLIELSGDKYFVDETYAGDVHVYQINFEDIPQNYLPSEKSFCPKFNSIGSLDYCISLNGLLSDEHKALPFEVNEINSELYGIINGAASLLNKLDLTAKTYSKPSLVGSYELNFSIELERRSHGLFKLENSVIANFLSDFFNLILVKLPKANVDIIRNHTDELLQLGNEFNEILVTAGLQIDNSELVRVVSDTINETAQRFDIISSQIKQFQSFNQLEFINYDSYGNSRHIGHVDAEFYDKIKDKLVIKEDFDILDSYLLTEDAAPKEYRILVYQLNTESGVGKAKMFIGDSEDFIKVSLKCSNTLRLENSVFTKSLHEGMVVTAKGIGQFKDGVTKKITF
jgi:hypothetical protein